MDILPGTDSSDALPRRIGARDGLLSKVSVMGQVTTLLAMASTGIVAGALAHDAQMKDLLAAQARQLSAPTGAVPPASPLVPKPIRTLVIGAPPTTAPGRATASKAVSRSGTSRRTAPRTTTARRYAAPARTVVATAPVPARTRAPQPAPKAAAQPPKAAAQPPATTSSGS